MSTTGFLDICGPVVPGDARTTGTAVLRSSRFRRTGEISENALLVEGLNQFAVRLGRQVTLHGGEGAGRLLPVAIKSLELFGQVDAEDIVVRGEAKAFGPTLRIHVRGQRAGSGADVVRATIVVAVVSKDGAAGVDTLGAVEPSGDSSVDLATSPLFLPAPVRHADDAFAFVVNPKCPILKEHFPGFPIAPGSQIMGYVAARLSERADSAFAWTRLGDVQFVGPVVPGITYRGRIRSEPRRGKPEGHGFTLLAKDDKVVTRGTMGCGPQEASAGAP